MVEELRKVKEEHEEPEWANGSRCIWQLGDVCMGEHVILARDGDTYWIRDNHGGYDMADREELRPICTPTQRAENGAVEEMVAVAKDGSPSFPTSETMMRRLYRAGYRRQDEEDK